MANHPQPAAVDAETPWRLTDGLNDKLAEVRGLGLEVQWIEASMDDLTRLVLEGGDAAIRLDPDPAVDLAWFGEVEIRFAPTRAHTWVFLRGEVAAGEISAHVVTPPEPA